MNTEDNRDPGPATPVGDAITKSFERIPLAPSRPARVLVMYSGGLDSVVLLANLLATTEHEIHAHHIVLDNGEKRAGAEIRAVSETYDWCSENLRTFAHSESGHTFPPGGGAGGWDTTLTMFTAARVTRWLYAEPVDIVVTGHIRSGFRELAEGQSVFSAALQSRRRRDPDWVRPLAWLGGSTQPERKANIAASIPSALVERAWWCRRPVSEGTDWRPCEECHACTAMTSASDILAERAADNAMNA
jgi:7-cyano-7-deazaguanine synthase in queuosine biosynthesis